MVFYIHTCKSVCLQSWFNVAQRLHRLLLPQLQPPQHTHSSEMHIFRHRHFCSNNVYYSMFDTVVYMYCPPMMPCGVGSYGLDNGWNTTSFSLFFLLVFWGGDSYISHPVEIFSAWKENVSSLGSDHKHIPDYSLCCHLNPDSFLLRYMCPVLANSHVYKYVYTCAIHKQSITVTTIAISFFQLFVLILVLIFLLMDCVAEA